MNITQADIDAYREEAYECIKQSEELSGNDLAEFALNSVTSLCDTITILCDFIEDYLNGIH